MKDMLVCAVAASVLAAFPNPLPTRVAGLPRETASWRCVGPGGGGWIQSMLWSRHAPDRLFVGCDVGGFYCSENGGRSYEMRNRGLTHMFVETIAEHPADPDILFLGSQGGIFRTSDRGRTWREARNGLPAPTDWTHSVQISKFAFDPKNPGTVYAAVGQPRTRKGGRGEIWRSDDGGASWRMIVKAGLARDVNIFDLSVDDADGRRMLIATDRGLFRSADGGAAWTASNDGLPPHLRTRRLARCPAAPDVVYVSLRQKGGERPWSAGVYRSDDGGITWQARNRGLRQNAGKAGCDDNLCTWVDCLAVDPRDPDTVWAGGATWWDTGVCRTTDGGRSWTHVFGDRRPGWITFWGPSVTCLALSAADPGRCAFGTSGMVYATEDGGANWFQRYTQDRTDGMIAGTGLEVTCLHSVTPSRHRKGRFFLGYYDIGLLVTEDGGRTLARRMTGVPGRFSNSCFCVAEAPDNPQTVWAGFGSWSGGGSGCVARSADGGRTWSPSCTNTASGWVDAAPRNLTVFGRRPDYHLLYASDRGLFESRDGGTTWSQPAPSVFPEAARVRTLARAADRLYAGVAGTDDAPSSVFVLRLRDDGALSAASGRWTRLTPPALVLGSLRSVSAEGDRILVTARKEWRAKTHETRPGGVWLSVDAGTTWRQVHSDPFCAASLVSDGDLFVALADHPYHDRSVGGGVIHSRDDGKTWTALDGPGLQNWNVSALAADPFDPKSLWAGTGGNSVFVGRLGQ